MARIKKPRAKTVRRAKARMLQRDTAFPQKDKGTETAHGTDHHATHQRFGVSFNTRQGPVSFLRRNVRAPKPAAWLSNARRNHNTNKQFPKAAAVRPRAKYVTA